MRHLDRQSERQAAECRGTVGVLRGPADCHTQQDAERNDSNNFEDRLEGVERKQFLGM